MFAEENLSLWVVPIGFVGIVTGIWIVQRAGRHVTKEWPPGQARAASEGNPRMTNHLFPSGMEWRA